MATRNPSDYTRWIEKRYLPPNKPILASTLDAIFDDQEFALDAQMLVISDCFAVVSKASGSYAPVCQYFLESKDTCDVSGVTSDEFVHDIFCLVTCPAGTTGVIRQSTSATSDAGPDSYNLNENPTTWTWVASADMNFETHEIEGWLLIELTRSTGSGTIKIAGIAMFARET